MPPLLYNVYITFPFNFYSQTSDGHLDLQMYHRSTISGSVLARGQNLRKHALKCLGSCLTYRYSSGSSKIILGSTENILRELGRFSHYFQGAKER